MAENPLACPCCGLEKSSKAILLIKEYLDVPFAIHWTSGTRCEKHNEAVKGGSDSGHLAKFGDNGDESVALDGVALDPSKIRQIAVTAIKGGAKGFGVYADGHFHIDLKPRIAWWRVDLKGVYDYFFPREDVGQCKSEPAI